MATSEFAVANSDLQKIQPDILGFGVTDFGDQLQFAENDVLDVFVKNGGKDTGIKLDTKI